MDTQDFDELAKERKRNDILFIVSMAIVILTLFIGVYYLYLMFWPAKVITANSDPLKIVTEEVRHGEMVQYVADVCKSKDIQARGYNQFVNHVVINTDSRLSNMPAGCEKFIAGTEVPDILPPGEYRLRVSLTYKVNPIREVTQTFETEPFTIIE